MTRYVHLDTSRLDTMSDRDRYTEAGKAIEQARQIVSEAAAYRDAHVVGMVAARPGRGGQSEVARILGAHRNAVSTHLKNHKERTMSHTVTEYVPVLKREISVTWERTSYPENLGGGPGPWRATINGQAAALHYNGAGRRDFVSDYRVVIGDQEHTITTATEQDAMKEAAWRLAVQPAIDAHHRGQRESQDS